MKSQSAKTYLKPEDVPSAKAKNTLAFLNSVTAVEEIADAIEIPGERDIGIRLAKRILDRRLMLGGFKDIKQIAAIPQIGPDRFARIIEALGTKTNVSIPHLVEGRITSTGKIDFGKAKLAVHAFVGGVEVARSKVNAQGKYKITFEHKKPSPATELRVLPAALSHRAAKMLTLSKTISSSRYALKKGYRAQYDLLIPTEYLVIWGTVTKTYHMQGAVYATVFSGSPPVPISIEPLPAAKIEFYEVDAPLFWIIGTEPELAEVCLGYTYTGPDGSYDFEFDFSYKNNPGAWSWLLTDKVPDIRARVSQFMDGLWQQVYEGPVDWNIVEDFHRDYFVPVEDILPVPDEGVKPDEGFRFVSVGLLPIDSTRIQYGYATAQVGDPERIDGISHQPFCGTLRIFGLFAETPPVASYKVQIADADEDGAIGSWQDVTDPLHNRKWNDAQHRWDHMVLGPDPVTGRYQNIDIEPEADWHEHALKVTWHSANEPNGYYALRIVGYDAEGAQVGDPFEMPVMRVDNDRPEASLEVMGAVTKCGALQLGGNRKIQFKITAHDSEGHVRRYWISGTRGKEAESAGTAVNEWRPDPTIAWTGEKDHLVDFTVASLSGDLVGCPSVAYNFELHVWGLATDCYNETPGSQRIKRETNLVVSEP